MISTHTILLLSGDKRGDRAEVYLDVTASITNELANIYCYNKCHLHNSLPSNLHLNTRVLIHI
jgi:hypothetical protein